MTQIAEQFEKIGLISNKMKNDLEMDIDEKFMTGLNLGTDYDIITWKSFYELIKPSIKNFDKKYENYKYQIGVIVNRKDMDKIINDLLETRLKGEIHAYCKRNKVNPYKIKVLDKEAGASYVHSIVRGIKVYMKRRKLHVEENKIQSYETQIRTVAIEYIWELVKNVRKDVEAQNRALIESFDPSKIVRVDPK